MQIRCIIVVLSLLFCVCSAQAEVAVKRTPDHLKTPLVNKIDLNHADLSSLTGSFKGIGKKRAAAIIAYREAHKGFKSLEEFAEIKGFGQRFVENNRDKLKEVFELR